MAPQQVNKMNALEYVEEDPRVAAHKVHAKEDKKWKGGGCEVGSIGVFEGSANGRPVEKK